MKLLAIDYGARRTGLAVSDASGSLARPLATLQAVGTAAGLAELLAIVRREAPDRIIVGHARTPSGRRGRQAQAAEAFAGRLRSAVAIPIDLEDERFTTIIANRIGHDPARLDARAAAVLLQGVLDRRDAAAS